MSDVLLRCEQIHKSYLLGRTMLPVLRGVDLSIRAGQLVAITGASGSGKSTLLHVMSGLDVPQRGQIYYMGEPTFEPEGIRRIPLGRESTVMGIQGGQHLWGTPIVNRPSPNRQSSVPQSSIVNRQSSIVLGSQMLEGRRNRLLNSEYGFVFQFYHLLPEFDVLENVLLPQMVGRSMGGWLSQRGEAADRAHDLLHRVGLSERLRHRPNELSGGERQRVAIARALINQPAVLFADEPTGNLDAHTGRDIFSLLKELNESGQTIVMVTHDHDLANQADVVVRLTDGRVAGVVHTTDGRVR